MYEPRSIGSRVILLLCDGRNTTAELFVKYMKTYGEIDLQLFEKELAVMRRAGFLYRDDIGRWTTTGSVRGLSAL